MKDNARLAGNISKARGHIIDAIKKPTKRPGNKQSRLSRLARKRSNIHGTTFLVIFTIHPAFQQLMEVFVGCGKQRKQSIRM